MDTIDTQIINLIQQQQEKGIRMLFERYYRPMVCYARDLIQRESVAEDLVQELFIRIWEEGYLKNFVSDSLSSYLFTAVRNRCISWIKKKDVLKDYEVLNRQEFSVEVVSGIDEKMLEQLEREVEKLTPRCRQVLECVMVRNLKYREAAEEMGISVNTVKFLLKEATRRLRSRLSLPDDFVLLFFFKKNLFLPTRF